MRKMLVLFVGVLMLFLVGCSGQTNSQNSTDDSVKGGSEPKEKIVLKYHSYAPKASIDEPMIWFAQEVSKRSGVDIQYEYYWAGALAGPADNLDALSSGAFDVTWDSPILHPGKTPYLAVANALPTVSSNLEAITAALNELATEGPGKDELAKFNVRYLFATSTGNYDLLSKKPVNSANDLKGFKARTFGYLSIPWSKMGGTPVSMTVPEVYSGLQSGLLDGYLSMPSGSVGIKAYEIAKYYIPMDGLAMLPAPFLMNKDTWNKLPQNVRDAMQEVAKEMPRHVAEIVGGEEKAAIDTLKQNGVEIQEMPADIKNAFEANKEAVWAEAAQSIDKQGLPGKDAVNTWVELVKKHEGK